VITFVVEDGTGLSSATSYVSVEEADDIASLNIHSADAWLDLPLEAKQNLLIYVSRILDSRTTWVGNQASPIQGLAWPRTGVVDRYGNTVSAAAVPYAVRMAVVELAKHTMTEDRLSKSSPDSVVQSVKVDSISINFAQAANTALSMYKTPQIVTDLLLGLGNVRNSMRKITFGKLLRT
jgi:hypothetical protein